MDVQCSSLEDVRQRIDEIDRAMVELIARRGGFVAQAARFKKDSADVRAPARVEQVIAKVRALASQRGASAEVVGSPTVGPDAITVASSPGTSEMA